MTKLDKMISSIRGEKVYIQTHNFPDPDAIASAYGIQFLLKAKGIDAQICYKGNIEKTVASKMVKLLDIKMMEVSSSDQIKDTDEIIIVDAQKGNANIIDMDGEEIICIDHHPVYNNDAYLFSDIRPEVGACASIITSYYYENNIPIDKHLATALLYGIKVDTADMKRGVSRIDLDMFYKLYELADHDVLANLDSSVLQFEDLKAYAHAITSIDIYNDVCFACAGNNCQESLVATICDFVMSLDGIDFAVVYSVKTDGVKLSIRSNGKYDAGTITNKALEGVGNGGGHEHMAGGFISESNLRKSISSRTKNKCNYIKINKSGLIDEVRDEIEQRFLRVINGNGDI